VLDTSAFALTLTFAGTLGVAFLIFVGQVISFTVLLGLAAAAQLVSWAVRALGFAVRMAFLNNSVATGRHPDFRR
jgi:hypothetical protein